MAKFIPGELIGNWNFMMMGLADFHLQESCTAIEFMTAPHVRKPFWSRENKDPVLKQASNSEIRRWLEQKAVEINGEFPGPKDTISLPVHSLVLFPKSKHRRCTLM